MSSRPVAPTARSAVATALCVGLGAGAHRAMSAAPVPAWTLGFGAASVFVFARVAAIRERGLAAIVALVGGSQVGLHLLFSSAQSAADGHSMSSEMDAAGVRAHGAQDMSLGMTVAHAVSALILAWWLRRGEAAAHRLARWTRSRISRRLFALLGLLAGTRPEPSLAADPARSTATAAAGRLRPAQLIRFTVIRRGPPPAIAGC